MNKDRAQPDGRTITDADLIRPGWILRLPADASGPGLRAVDPLLPHARPAAPHAPAAPERSSNTRIVAQAASPTQESTTQDAGASDVARYVFGGGLLAAGLVTMLARRRGAYGSAGDDAVEQRLRLAADPGLAGFLDTALRTLADGCARAGVALPEAYVAFLQRDELVVHFSPSPTSAPPAPWVATDDGSAWRVRADQLGEAPDVMAPYPALVNIGTVHGSEVLLDLEAAPGVMSVGGDAGVARDVVVSMAVELATNMWSDGVDVTLVGFGDDLTDIAPQRISRVSTVTEAVRRVESEAPRTAALLRSLGMNSVLAGRASRTQLRPHVMVLSGPPSAEDVTRISQAEGAGRSSVAVLCVGDAPTARWRFSVSKQGQLDLGILGVEVTAHRLTAADCAGLLELVRASDSDRKVQDRAISGLTPEAAAHAISERTPPPAAPATRHTPAELLTPAEVEVRLLGPVTVMAPGSVDASRLPVLTEIVVTAALHRDGLHDAMLRSSVWPRGVEDDVLDAAVVDVQSWLGLSAAGQPRLRLEEDGRWVLADDVRTDWDVLRGVAESASEGPDEMERLAHAMAMVSGEAFSGVPDGRYAWLTFHRAARDARLVGTAVARRLSGLCLKRGDHKAAESALRAGLVLVPGAQILWRDLMKLLGDDPVAVRSVVDDMWVALAGQGREARPDGETDALIGQLLPNYARSVG